METQTQAATPVPVPAIPATEAAAQKTSKAALDKLEKFDKLQDELATLIKTRDDANGKIVKLEKDVKDLGLDLVEEVPLEKLRPSQLLAYFQDCGDGARRFGKYKTVKEAWSAAKAEDKAWILGRMGLGISAYNSPNLGKAFTWSVTSALLQNYLNQKRLERARRRVAKAALTKAGRKAKTAKRARAQ